MSYDIGIVNKVTGEQQYLPTPMFVRGGTVPASVNPYTGQLEQTQSEEAHINITYNYTPYYDEAAEGDERLLHYWKDDNPEYGIRGLYGKSPSESIPILQDLVQRIKGKYTDEHGNWVTTTRTKATFVDKEGNNIDEHPVVAMVTQWNNLASLQLREYCVHEGDTSDYWEATAQNAILPLMNMIAMASQFFEEENLVWDGD